jgi:Secretion system C-terminal sorting domain
MKKHTTTSLRKIAGIIALCFSVNNSFASHLVGVDLYYTHISGDTIRITLNAYGDCAPASAAAFSTLPTSTPNICIFDGTSSVTSISLTIDTPSTGTEITPLCSPTDSSTCTNPSSAIPGIKKFTYSSIYVMPYASANWRFVYSGSNGAGAAAGRAAAITNITMGTTIQLQATYDNTTYYNSSPMLTVTQQTFFCNGQPDTYTPGAVDPDADSLSITLVNALSSPGSCTSSTTSVIYTGTAWPGTPISALTPISVIADSFSVDGSTGTMNFHPGTVQRDAVVYNINEYRHGALVGSSQREMTVLVLDCATAFPCMADAATSTLGVNALSNGYFSVFPDPASSQLTVRVDKGIYSAYTISNTAGQILVQQQLTGLESKVNISTLPSGVYYITVKGQGGVSTRKFVKM